jgi:hypothetical protein
MLNVYNKSFNVSYDYMKDFITNQILPSMKQIENEKQVNLTKKKDRKSSKVLLTKTKSKEIKEVKEVKEDK